MSTTRPRIKLCFEEIAGEYRIFLLEHDVYLREVVYDKERERLYVPRPFIGSVPPSTIEVVSVLPRPEQPIRDWALGRFSNPYGFHLYSHRGGMSAYVTAAPNEKGKLWIDVDEGEVTIEHDTRLKSRPSVSGNDTEEVDLASGMIVGRVTVGFLTTPGDAESGLLQFSSQEARKCPRVNEGQPPLPAIADRVARKIRAHFHVGKIYIMPKEVMLV
ncbi:hypothetical protein PG996_011033 [Apiospora saccharicola]|uniref:Uncharacterized protein n=1 Tax=Apiospora saccharicola TaxID=335842 RepID=A0ABR1UG62_9PEZI